LGADRRFCKAVIDGGFEPLKKNERERRGQTIAWRSYTVHSDGQLISLHIDPAELAKIQQR